MTALSEKSPGLPLTPYTVLLCALLGALLGTGGCNQYAPREELLAVEKKVEKSAAEQAQKGRETRSFLVQTEQRIGDVEARQAATETAFVEMGKGFNVLSEAVQEAHSSSQEVDRRQRRYEKSNESRWRKSIPVLPQPDADIVWLYGQGHDWRTRSHINSIWLRLDPHGTTLFFDSPAVDSGSPVEQIGSRLYAEGINKNSVAVCLTLLTGEADGGDFVAADCGEPMRIYRFSVSEPAE